MVKLLMSWDIKPGVEQEYFDFVVKELVPGLTDLGIRPTDAWYTVYGNRPQILTAGVAETVDDVRAALASDHWQTLEAKLEQFVENLEKKVIRAGGGFQL